jgi:ATP-dependent RNA helicase DDX27
MATDGDFVFTISDHDEDVLSNPNDSEIVPAPPKANIGKKRKRGLDSQLEAKKSSKKTKKSQSSSEIRIGREARLDHDERASGSEEEGQPDEAINPDFEFDFGPNYKANATEDFDGWDLEARPSNNAENAKKGVRKAVDIDEIIARRASAKQESNNKAINSTSSMGPADDLQSEQALEEGGYEDDDEQEGRAGFLDFGDDELLAMDGFGAGAASEYDEGEDAEHGKGSKVDIWPRVPELAQGDSEAEDSDADSVASPTAHPDDLESDDEDTASIASGEDAEEAAKRAAFFAPEDAIPHPKNKHTIPSESNSFQQFSLSRPLLRGIAAVNFLSPTPIQKRTIPIALAGKDVVGSAVTGSGKTAAFLLPILERLLYRPKKVPTTRVAILLPTRELAVQCHNVAMSLAQFTDITFAQLVGGFSVREQEALLKRRPDVVIATPGRFIDHMRNSASFAVEGLEILVLDEADRMLEDGFADELDEILRTIPKGRQTMLFSATMTESVDKLVRVGMNRPVRVSVDAQKATVEGLVQEFVRLRPGREEKRMASLLLLCTKVYNERVIVFFRQKKEVHRAKIIFGLFGLKSGELHGGMSQEQVCSSFGLIFCSRPSCQMLSFVNSENQCRSLLSIRQNNPPSRHRPCLTWSGYQERSHSHQLRSATVP